MTIRQTLEIKQGQTWSWTYVHKDSAGSPIDVSLYTAKMAVKSWYGGGLEAYLSSVSSESRDGDISLDASGNVTLSLTAANSAKVAGELSPLLLQKPEEKVSKSVCFVYDLELKSPSGDVTRALEGKFVVHREVTS